jgi:hypothetical protein
MWVRRGRLRNIGVTKIRATAAARMGAARLWWHNRRVAKKALSRSLGDVAIVCGKDSRGVHILRRRSEDGPIEAGLAQPLTEGKPITGEVISMRRRDDLPFVFDVNTEVPAAASPDAAGSLDGPAQVATDSYRRGWEAIWGGRSRAN